MKRSDYGKILHSCEKIVKIEKQFNEAVDGLLDNIGITRKGFKTGGGLYAGKNRKTTAR